MVTKRGVERVVVAGHRLPAAEAEILRLLLTAERPLLVAEVRDRLPGRKLAHTTVITLLGRLVKRRLVHREGDSRGHRYVAAGTEEELAVAALNEVVAGIDDPARALVAFINDLPVPTRRGLRRALREKEEEAR